MFVRTVLIVVIRCLVSILFVVKVYGVKFHLLTFPEKLEVYIRGDNSESSLLIQVTDDCQFSYSKPASLVDDFASIFRREESRKRRSISGNQRSEMLRVDTTLDLCVERV